MQNIYGPISLFVSTSKSRRRSVTFKPFSTSMSKGERRFARPYLGMAARPRISYWLLILCLCMACSVKIALAQTGTATISGTVTDPSGKVVPDADVSAVNMDTNAASSTKTNADGIYVVAALQPGRYRVRVSKQGFRQIELTDVNLNVQDLVSRNFRLEVGTIAEVITVQGNGININTSDGSVSTVIDRDFVDEIPLNGRTLQNLLPLSPGVFPDQVSAGGPTGNVGDSGYSVNGNRDAGSLNWSIDGVSGNFGATLQNYTPDSLAAGMTVLNTTQSLVSLDALQEFRLSTSSYGVEYGVAPGAQVQLQSRSGVNQLHGSAYDYLRNTVFDANDWFAQNEGLSKAPEQQNDFGGTLGGPIWIPHLFDGKEKAFFFFSFEDLHLLQPVVESDQPVPTAAYIQSAPATLQPYLSAFPAPSPNTDLGNGWALWNASFSQPSRLQAWSIRGDYDLSKSVKFFARVNDTPSNVTALTDAYQTHLIMNDLTTTVGMTLTPTPTLTSDFRFNFSRSTYAATESLLPSSYGGNPGPATAVLTPPSQYLTPGSGYFSDIVFEDDTLPGEPALDLENQASKLHQWNIVDGLKWQLGRHVLKFGGEWNRHTAIQQPIAYSETVFFYSLSSISASTADELDLESEPFVVSSITTRSALYAGDTWKATDRLSIDYGVRWELPFPTYFSGPYTPFYISSIADPNNPTLRQSRTQYNMTWRNFAPRLGVAYLLRDSANYETVLRTGGGLFYSTQLGQGIGGVNYPDQAFTSNFEIPFPIDPSLLAPPQTGVVTAEGLSENSLVGVDQHLAVPRVWEWNVSVEQRLGASQSLTVSYVGSAGRKLFFDPAFFPASDVVEAFNFTENGSRSDYNSLQIKYDRHITHGLQALASYTWAHSIDNASQDSFEDAPLWGNSDFDVRNTVALAMIYDIPGAQHDMALKVLTSGWEISNNFQAHSGLPVTGLFAKTSNILPNGEFSYVPAELVPGQPIYLHGSEYPGGTKLNRAAFTQPAAGTEGDVKRNEFRDLGFWQLDTSIQRKFSLGEKWGLLRFRMDAFNLFNHPNFGGFFVRNLTTSPLFGQAVNMADLLGPSEQIYNSGGPRSFQLSLRYEF